MHRLLPLAAALLVAGPVLALEPLNPDVLVLEGTGTYGWLNTLPDLLAAGCAARMPTWGSHIEGDLRVEAVRNGGPAGGSAVVVWSFDTLAHLAEPCVVSRPCAGTGSPFGFEGVCLNTKVPDGRFELRPIDDGWAFHAVWCDFLEECEYVEGTLQPA